MEQDNIRKALKIAKIIDNDFCYQDIADLLQIKVTSVYNFLANNFDLSQKKARYLSAWLSDKGFLEENSEK